MCRFRGTKVSQKNLFVIYEVTWSVQKQKRQTKRIMFINISKGDFTKIWSSDTRLYENCNFFTIQWNLRQTASPNQLNNVKEKNQKRQQVIFTQMLKWSFYSLRVSVTDIRLILTVESNNDCEFGSFLPVRCERRLMVAAPGDAGAQRMERATPRRFLLNTSCHSVANWLNTGTTESLTNSLERWRTTVSYLKGVCLKFWGGW